mgnify:CR=1 FL=1
MQASDTTAELQLLNGIVTQLGKGDVALTDSFRRHATAALLTVQQAVRACDAQQPSKLSESFQKLLDQVLKRSSRYQVRRCVPAAGCHFAAAAASDCCCCNDC